jgi:7-cyano-7-deazaguanine synthase
MSNCVVIFSGGADSTVILYHAIQNFDKVYCLTYNYNQRHKLEIEKAINYTTDLGVGEGQKIEQHTIVDLTFYAQLADSSALTNPNIDVPKMKDVIGEAQNKSHVPNRNMTMLSIAAAYAESRGCDTVLYGAALVDDTSGHWDGTREFLERINSCLALNRLHKIQIEAPLIKMSKEEIFRHGLVLGVDFSKTLTCYNGQEIACGTCPACSSRIQGWIKARLIDPVKYAIDIDWNKYGCYPIMS